MCEHAGMGNRPEQRPEGRLIGLAQKRSRLSQRQAAKRAGMSEARWRNIVSGYQSVSAGVYIPVRGPAETVARMAQVVGVTPKQLAEAGREDAAEELRDLAAISGEDDDSLLTPEEIAVIERIRSNPRKRRRLVEAILAASGHIPESTDTGENETPGHSKSG
jgi:transcriptional regulator with XRE-family HTH domain